MRDRIGEWALWYATHDWSDADQQHADLLEEVAIIAKRRRS